MRGLVSKGSLGQEWQGASQDVREEQEMDVRVENQLFDSVDRASRLKGQGEELHT